MHNLPKISIITPSFNQVKFLERTILSVINQKYPNLEYIIVDGGSTDGSVEIIKKYQNQLAWWVSEKDNGQTHAINKGLLKASGELIGWQNSDDIYYKDAFYNLAIFAKKNPDVDLIVGDMMIINEEDKKIRDIKYVTPTYNSVLAEGMVLSNQASFWRKKIHKDIGYLDEKYQYSFDREWFLRVLKYYKAKHFSYFFGAIRQHKDTKSKTMSYKFKEEQIMIMSGKNLSFYKVLFYKFRRTILTILNGNLKYVFRGINRRIFK